MTLDLVLFDLDGTLTDPLIGMARSLNYALSHYGYAPLEVADVASFVGPPLDQTFRFITGIGLDAPIAALVAKYRERYADVGYSENSLYAGVPEALARLRDANIALAVCTSKRADFAERILEMFGLRSYYRFVNGGDIGVEKWQQVAALQSGLLVTRSTVMVGDRAVDMIAAHRNGLRAGGVLWGYGTRAELEGESPCYLFSSPGELPNLTDKVQAIRRQWPPRRNHSFRRL